MPLQAKEAVTLSKARTDSVRDRWELVLGSLTIVSSTIVSVVADGSPWLTIAAITLLVLGLGLAIHSVYNLSRYAPRQTTMRRMYFIAGIVVWLAFVVASQSVPLRIQGGLCRLAIWGSLGCLSPE